MRRTTWMAAALLAGVALAGSNLASGADIAPGETRTIAVRAGVTMREHPRALSKAIATLPYGERVKVQEVEGLYALIATEAGAQGWVRALDLVEPTKLTGPGAYGPQALDKVASADMAAAGRQFDQKTEKTYRHMRTDVDAAYPLIDRLESGGPRDEDVLAFVHEGGLGGTNELPAGAGGAVATYARLRLKGASGDAVVEISAPESMPILEATPTTEAEFIERLGKEFSPEQEYWLGRSVAAAAIAEHGLDPDAKRQALVQKVGRAIVMLSPRVRSTFGGWHFAVLDDDAANGMSGPGGYVLITRGAIEMARNEDEVAGILAHEMAHVCLRHGEAMIRRTTEFNARLVEMREKIIRPAKGADGCNLCADVARLLGESSADLIKTLDVEGYGKEMEMAADWDASLYLCEVGYRASSLAEYLEVMPEREKTRWTTHPDSAERIEALRPMVLRQTCTADADIGVKARLARFQAAASKAPAAPKPVKPPAVAPPAPARR